MKKFLIILQKEIRELLTPRMVLPLVIVVIVFYFVGQYTTNEAKKSQGPQEIAVMDQDNSELSKSLVALLSKNNFSPKEYSGNESDFPNQMKQDKVSMGFVIPSGFEESVKNFAPKKIDTYSLLTNFSFVSISKYSKMDTALAIINETISNQYLAAKVTDLSSTLLKNPIQATPYTVVKDKTAEGSTASILVYLGSQAYIIPIILFLVVIVASQMIATSVASEKENKTLETLLTAPISRKMLVTAKMVGAGIVSLIFSVIYMLGFHSYITGVSGGAIGGGAGNISPLLKSLGLVLSPESYILLGIVVFLGILVALAIAMILGAFAEDVKSVQSVITPLMVLIMIPYFVVLLTDISTMPTVAKYIIYAIPFSHIFLAMPNLYLHNYGFVISGAIYELLVFIVFVWIAAWIFSSDKIMTMKLNFKKKKA